MNLLYHLSNNNLWNSTYNGLTKDKRTIDIGIRKT